MISADYICPARGLASLDPPEPERLLRAAKASRDLGVERLNIPVLEESLLGSARSKVKFLDGLILAMDRVAEAGLTSWLAPFTTKSMGLFWAPPYVVSGYIDPRAKPVFVNGGLRNLRFLDWWVDPALISRRIRLFRELLSAVAGHPGLKGWLVLDRAFDSLRPDPDAALFVLRSYLAEIRERDESGKIYLGLGWADLITPEPALSLVPLVDGIRVATDETALSGLPSRADLASELPLACYVAALALWLFEKPVEMQIGWGLKGGAGDHDLIPEEIIRLSEVGTEAINWLTLVDPEPEIRRGIPWSTYPGLERAGLFHPHLEPRDGAEEWMKAARFSGRRAKQTGGFIDIGRGEYLDHPLLHIGRFWDHFRESR